MPKLEMGAKGYPERTLIAFSMSFGIYGESILLNDSARIINGTALVRQCKVTGLTFGSIGNQPLKNALSIAGTSNREDVVFNTFEKYTIKNVERAT